MSSGRRKRDIPTAILLRQCFHPDKILDIHPNLKIFSSSKPFDMSARGE
jgi:hypothetical protein